jgi:ATP-dependent RNA helicase DeaD
LKSFNELGLSQYVLQAISEMGFEELTPIQKSTIPIALEGKDLIGQAQTGTGKTAAYGIPIIEKISLDEDFIQAVVLTPTRELAMQVAEELNRIGQFKKTRALPIYGGQDINRQIKALKKKPQIIVATPGRLLDHMRRRTIRLNNVQFCVLDEADEMLNMGFVEDIESILGEIPIQRQTMLFSATIPKSIEELANRFMKKPEIVRTQAKEVTVPLTEQVYLEVHERDKLDILSRLLDLNSPELAIIFARTKRRVDELGEALAKRGYAAESIHGDLTQARRDAVMKKFREGTIELLVATDVAARGLDISGISHVFNFDIPQDPESYVHRIGRTGRAGKSGLAFTFVTPREFNQLRNIENVIKRKIKRLPTPTLLEAFRGQQRLTVERLLQVVAEEEYDQYKGIAQELLEQTDSVTLLAAALKMLTKEPVEKPTLLSDQLPKKSSRSKERNRYSQRGRKTRNR